MPLHFKFHNMHSKPRIMKLPVCLLSEPAYTSSVLSYYLCLLYGVAILQLGIRDTDVHHWWHHITLFLDFGSFHYLSPVICCALLRQ